MLLLSLFCCVRYAACSSGARVYIFCYTWSFFVVVVPLYVFPLSLLLCFDYHFLYFPLLLWLFCICLFLLAACNLVCMCLYPVSNNTYLVCSASSVGFSVHPQISAPYLITHPIYLSNSNIIRFKLF